MFICLAPNKWMDVGSIHKWSHLKQSTSTHWLQEGAYHVETVENDDGRRFTQHFFCASPYGWPPLKVGHPQTFFCCLGMDMNGLFRASCCHLIIAEKAPAVLYKFKCLQYITSPLLQQLFSGNTFRESICTRNLNPIVASPCLKLCPEKLEKYDSLDDVEISFLSGGQLEIGSGSSPKIVKSDFGEEITFESHGVSSFSGKIWKNIWKPIKLPFWIISE